MRQAQAVIGQWSSVIGQRSIVNGGEVGTIKSFEDLEAWQVGRSLRSKLYVLARRLPEHERYNLAPQIRSAAASLTANLAEGYERFHFKENVQFCRIARGSANELKDHLINMQR